MKLAWSVGISLFCLSTPVLAQSSSTGLTGLGEMRTPDTLQEDATEIIAMPGRYAASYGGVGKRLGLSVGLTQGLGDRCEVGVEIPYFVHSKDSGLSDVPLSAKYRFFEWQKLRFAGQADLQLPTGSRANGYGSGNLGAGVGLLGAWDFQPWNGGAFTLAGSLRYETIDYCPHCALPGDQLPEPRSIPATRAAGGIRYLATGGYAGFAELHADLANDGVPGGHYAGDPDWYALVGGHVPIQKRFAVTGYVGGGLKPQGSSNTKLLGGVMLHYTFDAGMHGVLERQRRGGVEPTAAVSAPAKAPVVARAETAPTPPPPLVAMETPTPVPTATPAPAPVIVVVQATPVPTPDAPPVKIAHVKVTEKAIEIGETIQFIKGSSRVDPGSSFVVDAIAKALNDNPAITLVRIEGHTDSTGNPSVNQRISTKRAEAVRDELIKRGVSAGRMQAAGLGETQPIASNDTPDGRLLNRRVEIKILEKK